MTIRTPFLVLVALAGAMASGLNGASAVRLTSLQRVQGWRLLFDGASVDSWRGFREKKVPAVWQVSGGMLRCRGGVGLVTDEVFKDFELEFEWMVEEGGTGAVHFRASEEAATPDHSGPKMELAGADGQTGGNGGLIARQLVRGVRTGDWYRARLVVFGNLVEHWINGERVLNYMLDDREWQQAKAASEYHGVRDYGVLREGHIVLSGTGIVFRVIKLKPL
jgi:hypothetical protein